MKVTVTVGESFSNLTVLRRVESIRGRAMWECVCQCGTVEVFSSKQLTTGKRVACINCQDSGSKSSPNVRLRKYEIADNGCWNWTGKKNECGYGVITIEGRQTRAHRAMFFLLNPDADRSLIVMHKCDNPPCVNPDHLSLGTHKDNMLDMHRKGRFKGGPPKGNRNAVGNEGWKKGGITAKYASRLGDEVKAPDELME